MISGLKRIKYAYKAGQKLNNVLMSNKKLFYYNAVRVYYYEGNVAKYGYASRLSQLCNDSTLDPDTILTLDDNVKIKMQWIYSIALLENTLETRIPDYFLAGARNFNYPITIPSQVTSIGNYFLCEASNFNYTVTLHSGITSIGSFFLSACLAFNKSMTIPKSVVSIGQGFMLNCSRFVLSLAWETSALPPHWDISYLFTSSGNLQSSAVTPQPSLCIHKIQPYSYSAPATPGADTIYNPGPTITGAYASQLRSRLPNTSGYFAQTVNNFNANPAYYNHFMWRTLR